MGSGRYTAEFYTDNDTKYLSFAILGYNITSAFTISKIRVAYGLGKYSFIDKFTLANNTTDGATISTTETPVVGAVNGYANYGCKNYGAGGIVGYVGDNVRIEYCTTRNSTVTGTAFVGGLAGQNLSKNGYTSSSANTGISDVYNCNVRNSNINSTGKVASAIKGVRPYGGFIGDSYQYTTPMQVSDTDLQNSSYTGGLIGYKYGGSVYGCEVTGSTITAKASIVGGIIGYSLMTQSVAMCKNTSDIEISESVITGYTSESDGEYVLGKFKYVGGIVGIVADYKPYRSVRYSGFTGCVNYGSITDNMSTSVSAYLTCVGGVAGAMYGGGDNKRSEYKGSTSASTYYNIKHKIVCYSANHGNITLKHHYYNSTNGDPEYIGGVIGRANTDSTGIEITYCYNTGVISASTGSYIGGLIGSYWRMYSTISYCFNVGRVVGSSTYKALIGQIGFTSNNTYTKNFYQEGVSNGNKDDTSVATEKTMNEMSSTSTLSTLGYSTTYMANSTTAGYYPCLNSNYAKGDTHIEATTSDAFDIAGDGYIIETAKHLEILADKVNNNRSGSLGQYSKQTYYVVTNINCGNNYIPIGGSESTPFMGTFKGVASRTSLTTVQTRTIAMYGYSSSYSGGAYELFGYTNGANISYITRGADLYSGSNTTGKSSLGGIVGGSRNSIISYCSNLATISGDQTIGGIVAESKKDIILNCNNTASITGSGALGGIVGSMSGSEVRNCNNGASSVNNIITGTSGGIGGIVGSGTGKIISCTNYGTIHGVNGSSVGGIAGYIGSGGTVESCINKYASSSTYIVGSENVGGIVGKHAGGNLKSCSNSASIYGGYCVGGIVGYATSSSSYPIVSCTNTGDVWCTGAATGKDSSLSYTTADGYNITSLFKIVGIGGVVGFSERSIDSVGNSGSVGVKDLANITSSADSIEIAALHTSSGYNVSLNGSPLGGFGGIVGYITGNNHIIKSQISGTITVGYRDGSTSTWQDTEVSGAQGYIYNIKSVICVGGLVGYMDGNVYMRQNTSANMGTLTVVGTYFAGAVVGYSCATSTASVSVTVKKLNANTGTTTNMGTITYRYANVQAILGYGKVVMDVHNPTQIYGNFFTKPNWKKLGDAAYGSKVGLMSNNSTYMVAYITSSKIYNSGTYDTTVYPYAIIENCSIAIFDEYPTGVYDGSYILYYDGT